MAGSSQERADRTNQEMVRLTGRRMCQRAVTAILLLLFSFLFVGIAFFVDSGSVNYALIASAAFVLALVCGVLFLDAYGDAQEIRSRRWRTATPRFERAAPEAAATPSNAGRAS